MSVPSELVDQLEILANTALQCDQIATFPLSKSIASHLFKNPPVSAVHTDFCHMHNSTSIPANILQPCSAALERVTWEGCEDEVHDDLSFITAKQWNSLVKMLNGNKRASGIKIQNLRELSQP